MSTELLDAELVEDGLIARTAVGVRKDFISFGPGMIVDNVFDDVSLFCDTDSGVVCKRNFCASRTVMRSMSFAKFFWWPMIWYVEICLSKSEPVWVVLQELDLDSPEVGHHHGTAHQALHLVRRGNRGNNRIACLPGGDRVEQFDFGAPHGSELSVFWREQGLGLGELGWNQIR